MARTQNAALRSAIFSVCGQLGPRSSSEILEQLGRLGIPAPTDRTVRRYLEQWRQLSDSQRAEYTECRWPDSFEMGALPWEAAPAVAELLRAALDPADLGSFRPPVQLARWFWRVRTVAPEMDGDECRRLAAYLLLIERGLLDASQRHAIEAHALGIGESPAIAFTATTDQMRTLAPLLAASGIAVAPQWSRPKEENDDGTPNT